MYSKALSPDLVSDPTDPKLFQKSEAIVMLFIVYSR